MEYFCRRPSSIPYSSLYCTDILFEIIPKGAAKSSGFIWLHEVLLGGKGGLCRVMGVGNVEADAILEFPLASITAKQKKKK